LPDAAAWKDFGQQPEAAMLERFKRTDDHDRDRSGTATTAVAAPERERSGTEERRGDGTGRSAEHGRDGTAHTDEPARDERAAAAPARRGPLTGEALKTARARQRDEFGGLNWGASFFGWLVAVGVAAIMTALFTAAGAAVGLTAPGTADPDSIGLGGGIALLAALMLAYFCGGYVAGRMSRFDGARQGIGVWVIALVVTVALALLAVIAGDDYNVLEQLNLPAVPVGESEFRSGGWIVLLVALGATLVAALVGGKAGERYHRRVDRAGFVD
jgi:hypothetical protein